MQREKFSSRLGFILISAGCAIGLGNVWRFPYIVGKYGGAAFVLIYLAFLLILGLPIMVMEFSVGRASKVSAALSFDRLEPKGTKWHWYKYGAMAGNYLLMMFYTTIAGWMVQYFIKMMTGEFEGCRCFFRYACKTWNNDFLYDHCCCWMFCNLWNGASKWSGKDHKGYDAASACTDGDPCSTFCNA